MANMASADQRNVKSAGRHVNKFSIAGLTALFAAAFALTTWALPHLPLRPGQYPRQQTIPDYDDPGNDAFFATTVGDDLSHIVLYHAVGGSIANARKADILIIGNSRAQIGWRESIIHAKAEKLGLRVFNLAVGHGDTCQFALDLIRKHDIRPRIVIASGGPFIFGNHISDWGHEVMAMNAWEARKQFWERTTAWRFKAMLHRYLPRMDYFDQALTSQWIHYRSEQTGWWRSVLAPDHRYAIGFKKEKGDYRHSLWFARELKQELDRRNVLLVLTLVPYANTRFGHLPFLASKMGVPFVIPDFTGMRTADGSHLHVDSAVRISEDFWGRFIALGAVKEKLGLPSR